MSILIDPLFESSSLPTSTVQVETPWGDLHHELVLVRASCMEWLKEKLEVRCSKFEVRCSMFEHKLVPLFVVVWRLP